MLSSLKQFVGIFFGKRSAIEVKHNTDRKLVTDQAVASEISMFYYLYLQERPLVGEDAVTAHIKKVREHIDKLRITGVAKRGNRIIITSSRPGLLFGLHGNDFRELRGHLQRRYPKVIVDITEDKVTPSLYDSCDYYAQMY